MRGQARLPPHTPTAPTVAASAGGSAVLSRFAFSSPWALCGICHKVRNHTARRSAWSPGHRRARSSPNLALPGPAIAGGRLDRGSGVKHITHDYVHGLAVFSMRFSGGLPMCAIARAGQLSEEDEHALPDMMRLYGRGEPRARWMTMERGSDAHGGPEISNCCAVVASVPVSRPSTPRALQLPLHPRSTSGSRAQLTWANVSGHVHCACAQTTATYAHARLRAASAPRDDMEDTIAIRAAPRGVFWRRAQFACRSAAPRRPRARPPRGPEQVIRERPEERREDRGRAPRRLTAGRKRPAFESTSGGVLGGQPPQGQRTIGRAPRLLSRLVDPGGASGRARGGERGVKG
ncbi:hypothetical protein OH77DRAFT_662592 [Trametes cingulata]|nr:hypothetical protein OH77DRAFT_662592 [Trametes cingulata]